MKKILCASWILCATMNQAYAAHPLVTDDTGVQGEGRHQIEVNTDWSRQTGQAGHVGAFTYTYGITDKLDLFANLPLTFQSKDGTGVGDYSLGAKWRYYDEEGLSLAFKPEFFMPSGDEEKSLGNGRNSLGLTSITSYETGPWTLHGNVGLNYNRYKLGSDDQSKRKLVWRASAATWYALNQQWKLVADTGVAQNVDRGNRTWPAYALLGVIWSPNQTVDLDFGAKFGLNKAEVTRQFGVGITLHY
ncbi:transporter [Herbaspirillum robiniae]|uniref:Transporter n=2 Tax=Herbaspirillum robiniae TaxID=2014887 RepID=A0ABX2LZ99_9BURK|nr:transporter [Herbaspirillum robiniae]